MSICTANAQKADSLLNELGNLDGVQKLKAISEACKHAYYYENDKTDSLAGILLKEATTQTNKYYIGQSYYFNGLYDFGSANFNDAFENYTTALRYFQEVDSVKQVAEMYHNLSIVHSNLNNKKEAEIALKMAMDLNTRYGFTQNLINNKLVQVGYFITDNEEAIGVYEEIIELSKSVNYHSGVLISNLNAGLHYSRLGKFENYLECIKRAEDCLIYPGTQIYKNNILLHKANAYYFLKDYANAERYYFKLLNAIEEKEAKGDQTDKSLKISTLYNIAEAKKKQNDYKGSATYFKMYADQNDSLGLAKQAEAVASAEAKYKVELKDKENIFLKKEAKISEDQLSTARKQRVLLGLLLLTAIVVIVLLTTRYSTKQKHFLEVQKINEQVATQNKKLNQMNLEMEGILQVVSHDFRTPLAKIKMLNELLETQEKDNLSEKGKQKIGRIHKSVDEAEILVNDILELREFYNTGEVVSEPIAFGLKEEIESIVDDYKAPIKLKKLKVNIQVKGAQTVITELDAFKRVLGNLLSNAVKFSENETQIWIEASHIDKNVQLIVKDEGPGFTEVDKDQIFLKPGKLSNKPQGWGTSHGLGLYIVDKLVREQLKGTIALASESGQGAMFIVNWRSC